MTSARTLRALFADVSAQRRVFPKPEILLRHVNDVRIDIDHVDRRVAHRRTVDSSHDAAFPRQSPAHECGLHALMSVATHAIIGALRRAGSSSG